MKINEKALAIHGEPFGLPVMSEHTTTPHPNPPRFSRHLHQWVKAFAKEQWKRSAFKSILD